MTTTSMQITIKNLKHIVSMSQETYCFTANVFANGVKIGTAMNQGCGGSTDFHPSDNSKTYNRSEMENLINSEVHKQIMANAIQKDLKRLKKDMITKVCFIKDTSVSNNYGFFQLKDKSPLHIAAETYLIGVIRKKYPKAVILNGRDDAELLKFLSDV